MRKMFLTGVFVALLAGCAISTTTIEPQNPVSKLIFRDAAQFAKVDIDSLASDITSGQYVQRANNLFVLFDASSSATADYEGKEGFKAINNANGIRTKIEVQREILHRMNKTIAVSASALKLDNFKTELLSLGYGDCKGYGDHPTYQIQVPTLYSQEAYDTAIDKLKCANGRSELGKGLIKNADNTNPINHIFGNDHDKTIDTDLTDIQGNIALVIISDISKGKLVRFADAGAMLPEYLNPDLAKDDETAVKALRQKYGNRLCVYNVWMSSSNKSKEEGGTESEVPDDKELIYAAENPVDCGGPGVFTAERVAETDGMKEFMRAVLLSRVPEMPLPDCSQLDSDADGVNDCDDKCPNTLKGTPVNKMGCWIVDIKFDNDRSHIKPQYYSLLNNLAADITANFPNLTIEVQGHTSSTASAAYNQRLSILRAKAVTEYLDKRIHGPHKLISCGYGLTRPIDTNATAAGRANNRRVQLEVLQ